MSPKKKRRIFPVTLLCWSAISFCPKARRSLVKALRDRGFNCHPLPMTEFLKAGGACKCLTMFMPQQARKC